MTGAPDAGDEAFWTALGIPAELRDGIVNSAGVVEIWPENKLPLDVFSAMQTQWRTGFGGATGLDYTALPTVLDLMGVPPDARRDTFDALRIMEGEALKIFSEKQKNGR